MKFNNTKKAASVLAFVVIMMPTLAYGASLIPCGQPAGTPDVVLGNTSYPTTNECGFADLLLLVNIIIHFLMFDVIVPLTALGFVWAGGSLILNQNKEGAWSEAKERFADIGTGIAIILGAYVLIKVILANFLRTDAGFTNFLLN
ncbi:MAG: hypothetical protein HZB10_01855 [Candidatus Yonathbacteria bacterium]|nr:hypothetical protein [Candidatus Yonathbacteria bacterium]